MKNESKTIITAIAAAITTIIGITGAIGGLQADYGPEYIFGTLIIPALLWIGTVDFYQRYKKENMATISDK